MLNAVKPVMLHKPIGILGDLLSVHTHWRRASCMSRLACMRLSLCAFGEPSAWSAGWRQDHCHVAVWCGDVHQHEHTQWDHTRDQQGHVPTQGEITRTLHTVPDLWLHTVL